MENSNRKFEQLVEEGEVRTELELIVPQKPKTNAQKIKAIMEKLDVLVNMVKNK